MKDAYSGSGFGGAAEEGVRKVVEPPAEKRIVSIQVEVAVPDFPEFRFRAVQRIALIPQAADIQARIPVGNAPDTNLRLLPPEALSAFVDLLQIEIVPDTDLYAASFPPDPMLRPS